jgi:HEAT repeat protein
MSRAEIEQALADAPQVILGNDDLKRRQAVVERLAALPDDLRPLAEDYLKDLGPTSEKLTIVLDAMHKRGEPVGELAARALTAPGGAEREPYVDLLVEAAPETAAGPLIHAFDAYDEDSDVDGFLRAGILRALGDIGAKDGAQTAIAGLAHEDAARVRLAALHTLDQLDARQAAPALIERLEADEDPDVVAAAADLLGKWGHAEAVPALDALAASEWAQRSPEVKGATERALARLRS